MLEKYKKKRNFKETPEPGPGKANHGQGELLFVVQKHKARQLHYDLRLELNGVLKSWAVPKGPSLNPDEKHLAQMVEDHPIEYRDFEGMIPLGNYGAGTVMVWDNGTYFAAGAKNRTESEKMIAEGLSKGHISFVLNGRKLCGEFALVRLKRAGEASWLLIKAHDECSFSSSFSRKRESIKWDKSAKTGRTMEEITAEAPKEGESWNSNNSQGVILSESEGSRRKEERLDSSATPQNDIKGKKASIPKDVKPMMATLIKEPFDKKDWIFEVKWDGYRAIAEINHKTLNIQKNSPNVISGRKPGISSVSSAQNEIYLYSRNQKSFNEKFPEIVNAFQSFDADAVLDGEIVAVDNEGKPSFQLLQEYLMIHSSSLRGTKQSTSLSSLAVNQGSPYNNSYLIYYLFDIIYYDGYDLKQLPLSKRREILKKVMPKVPNIQLSESIDEKGIELFESAKKESLEGIMAKNINSNYQQGRRSKDWLKIKNHLEQEVVIGGFTAPRGSRTDFGSLAVGVYEKDKLVYIGNVGTGFNERLLSELRNRFEPLIQSHSPFESPPKLAGTTWLKPDLVCEVKFQEWTAEGSMRQPVFLGLRDDKNPRDVHKEISK